MERGAAVLPLSFQEIVMSSRSGLVMAFGFFAASGVLEPLAVPAGHALQAQGIRQQWENSPHARSMDTPEEQARMNRTGCAHCHSAEGYQEVILAGQESTAPYAEPTGLTCQACHTPREEGVPRGALRAGTPRQACLGCHDELVINTPEELSWTSQEAVFNGTGGAQIPGREYATSKHAELEKGCVDCHMASASEGVDAGRTGGHTFWVKTKGEEPALFNPGGCTSCHGGITLERMASSQQEVSELLASLAGLLPQKPHPTEADATEPRYPADPSLDEVTARASYNYWLIQKDGSLGVHNPRYARALLEASIEELGGG